MKLSVTKPHLFVRSSTFFSTLVRVVLSLLLVITVSAMFISVYKAGISLWHDIDQPLEIILRHILLDTVLILVLLEINTTILGYLKDGRVHVRYIVDTVLIIMLNEVVAMWFNHPNIQKSIGLSIIIGTLAAVRISVTRWAPKYD